MNRHDFPAGTRVRVRGDAGTVASTSIGGIAKVSLDAGGYTLARLDEIEKADQSTTAG